jgi:transcriptional regulator with XRE-family HTH domain
LSGFGDRLRETRESYGITLEQVEAETKIRKLYVEALENENFSILPPQVYVIGFVRRYAKMLNLDGDALSKEFKQLAYPEVIEEYVQAKPVKVKRELNLPQLPYRNIALAAVFLILAIWAGSIFADYLGNRVQNTEPKPPVNVGEKNPPQVVQPGKTETEQIKLQIKVKPDMKCWVRVLADGENKLETILAGGQEQTFTAEQSIYIKLGNAGAVDIIVDDKPIEPLGEIGQVVEKEFTKSDKS